MTHHEHDPTTIVHPAEFEQLFERCSNWGRWGAEDRLGTVNLITPEITAAAARLVETGTSVSCARPIITAATVDTPDPAEHRMTKLPNNPTGEVGGALDFLGVACHGEAQSHIDALCHIAYRGMLYNGVPATTVTDGGAAEEDLDQVATGISSRGVLLDVAAAQGKRWLESGELIYAEDLEAAERAAGLSVRAGDVVLLRTGQALRRETEGPWDSAKHKAGLHPRAMPWFKDHDVAALGFDGDGDAAPDPVPHIHVPIHVLGINATGLHTFDGLDLEALAATCRSRARWEFFFVALPLRLRGGTGSLINPVAFF
ncbi:MAG TPA: cyclase family protein [Solirubrobacterales bacterium]